VSAAVVRITRGHLRQRAQCEAGLPDFCFPVQDVSQLHRSAWLRKPHGACHGAGAWLLVNVRFQRVVRVWQRRDLVCRYSSLCHFNHLSFISTGLIIWMTLRLLRCCIVAVLEGLKRQLQQRLLSISCAVWEPVDGSMTANASPNGTARRGQTLQLRRQEVERAMFAVLPAPRETRAFVCCAMQLPIRLQATGKAFQKNDGSLCIVATLAFTSQFMPDFPRANNDPLAIRDFAVLDHGLKFSIRKLAQRAGASGCAACLWV